MNISPLGTSPGTPRPLPARLLIWLAPVALLAGLLALPGAASAQDDRYSFHASASLGIGGSLDANPDPGFDGESFQLGFSWVTQPRTRVGIRVGQLDFGAEEQLENLLGAELSWVNISGEYRYWDRFYESGIFVGLGLYDMDGLALDGSDGSDEAIGIVVGVTGDFPITQHFSAQIELAGHWAELDGTQLFGTLHGGVSYSF